jgi:dihydroxy-acid dehydratase
MSDGGDRRLRSAAWFQGNDKLNVVHRSWMKAQGFPPHLFDGRPVIGIVSTKSELTPCNAHLGTIAEAVKRGVYELGGFPLELPVMSLGESNMRPSAMMFRNLAAMDVEESIRANPIDGVVLLVGCDKTTPAAVMGATSVDLPTVVVSGGPMLSGTFEGRRIGSGTDLYRLSEEVRAGTVSTEQFLAAESAMSRSAGSCNTMGTASTMASLIEALGIALPGNAAIPAVDARRTALAHMAGRRIVEMVRQDLRLSQVLTRPAFENAIRINAAIGGSTNAVIHLLAIAGRAEVPLTLDDWDRIGRDVPTIVNLMPSGEYLMDDFFAAGGLPVVIRLLAEAGLIVAAQTVTGRALTDPGLSTTNYNEEVIRPLGRPVTRNGGIAILRGNLAPNGAVLKPSAASAHLLRHRGRAVVFESNDHYKERIADPGLDVDQDSVLVLKNAGPVGYPGMAEVGNMGLPPKLLARGIKDMVRISDARMSGTAYGTVVLHVAPEAAIGGPLALVREGDMIELDVPGRTLHLDVAADELERRRASWIAPARARSGFEGLFVRDVLQADRGCDFGFLVGRRGGAVPKGYL